MQFIIFLLGLFAIGCVLYGISAGVQIIQRGFSALASSGGNSNGAKESQRPPKTPSAIGTNALADTGTPFPRRCVQELQALFSLYQSGALTQQEFEQCKWHVLQSMSQGKGKPL